MKFAYYVHKSDLNLCQMGGLRICGNWESLVCATLICYARPEKI
jgi:hypothetical protein